VRRRDLLLAAKCDQPYAPVDVDKLNAFVEAYNRYIELLKGDVLDVKQWQKVLDKWERLK
jgi:hypothetical protein